MLVFDSGAPAAFSTQPLSDPTRPSVDWVKVLKLSYSYYSYCVVLGVTLERAGTARNDRPPAQGHQAHQRELYS